MSFNNGSFNPVDSWVENLNSLPEWLQWLDSCPSTNSWALAHLPHLNHGDVVFTRKQTAGRGQQGRVWNSSAGVLTASLILKSMAIAQLSGLSLMAGLAVVYALEELCPSLQNQLRLKWPNDVMVGRQKLAGILCEATFDSASEHSSVVVGIGLNRWAELDQMPWATSLHYHLQNQVDENQMDQVAIPSELQILERSRHYLLETAGLLNYAPQVGWQGLQALLPAIRQRDFLLGQKITVELGHEKFNGEALGISDRGHLLLGLENHEVRSFSSGHIIW